MKTIKNNNTEVCCECGFTTTDMQTVVAALGHCPAKVKHARAEDCIHLLRSRAQELEVEVKKLRIQTGPVPEIKVPEKWNKTAYLAGFEAGWRGWDMDASAHPSFKAGHMDGTQAWMKALAERRA